MFKTLVEIHMSIPIEFAFVRQRCEDKYDHILVFKHVDNLMWFNGSLLLTQHVYPVHIFVSWRNITSTDHSTFLPQKMKDGFKARASVCRCRIVWMCNLGLCGPTAAGASLTWSKLYYPFLLDHSTSGQEFGLAQLTVNDAV